MAQAVGSALASYQQPGMPQREPEGGRGQSAVGAEAQQQKMRQEGDWALALRRGPRQQREDPRANARSLPGSSHLRYTPDCVIHIAAPFSHKLVFLISKLILAQ